jgi:hypothetical protein
MADPRNPFVSDDPNPNPWTGATGGNEAGPAYGNAYEDSNNSNTWNYGSMRMPEPSIPKPGTPGGTMNSTTGRNQYGRAWDTDKIEVPPGDNSWNNGASPSLANQNPYQFSGTRYGNTDTAGNAYSAAVEPMPATPAPNQAPKPDAAVALPPVWDSTRSSRPSKSRLAIRFIQLIACIGSVGFAAGASPVST